MRHLIGIGYHGVIVRVEFISLLVIFAVIMIIVGKNIGKKIGHSKYTEKTMKIIAGALAIVWVMRFQYDTFAALVKWYDLKGQEGGMLVAFMITVFAGIGAFLIFWGIGEKFSPKKEPKKSMR